MIPSGILIINKEDGPTSHDVVAKIRRLFETKRVGHAGTLDPFATGVLVLLVGRATLISQFLQMERKSYVAEIKWGIATNTMDRTGTILEKSDDPMPSRAMIEKVLRNMRGELLQIPPMYSAKKINGEALHRLARKGITVTRKAVSIKIEEISLLNTTEDTFTISVTCSKGTYIRALADTIGRSLGGFAYLNRLQRNAAGRCTIDKARSVKELYANMPVEEDLREQYLRRLLIPVEQVLLDMPGVALTGEQVNAVINGKRLPIESVNGAKLGTDSPIRLVDLDGRLTAIGKVDPERKQIVLLRVLAERN